MARRLERPRRRLTALLHLAMILIAGVLVVGTAAADPAPASSADVARRLIRAYSGALTDTDGAALVWRDGTRMPLGEARPAAPLHEWLAAPTIADMFRWHYPAGSPLKGPPAGVDPGRARNAALFGKLYGDCRSGDVAGRLVAVTWLPRKWGKAVEVSGRHGMADALRRVSDRLDRLPPSFDRYLFPPAGTYACRPVAGEDRLSAHGYGIAIDLPVASAHYWRWARKPGLEASRAAGPWRNAIPREIVAAFEAEGFVWGGRWSHYDTMHFEYRPEMFAR